MGPERVKILLVEDSHAEARLLQVALSYPGIHALELVQSSTLHDSITRIREGAFDVVLLDLGLPDSRGLETFLQMYEANPDTPIVVLTGLNDEEVAIEAVKKGAQDYLVKGTVDGQLLMRSLRYAIERQRLTKEVIETAAKKKEAEDELQRRQTTHLWQSLYRILGRGATPVLYQAGAEAGPRTLDFVEATWRPQNETQLIDALREHLRSAGICEITKLEVDRATGRVSARVRNSFETSVGDSVGPGPRCHFLRGLLCGVGEKLLGRQELVCNEVECESQGKEACEFRVNPMFE